MIKSILAQTYSDIECIIVDDDPYSSLSDILELYDLNTKVRYLKNENNIGVAAASNVGLSYARGTYIAFVGDDDYFVDKKYFCDAVNILDNDKDTSSAFSGVYAFGENGGKLLTRTLSAQVSFNDLLMNNGIIFGSCCIHKIYSVLEVGGFDETCTSGTDSDLFRRMLKVGHKFIGLQRLSLFYDNRSKIVRMSSSIDEERLNARINGFDRRLTEYSDILSYRQKADLNYRKILVICAMRRSKSSKFSFDLILKLLHEFPLTEFWVKLMLKEIVWKIKTTR